MKRQTAGEILRRFAPQNDIHQILTLDSLDRSVFAVYCS